MSLGYLEEDLPVAPGVNLTLFMTFIRRVTNDTLLEGRKDIVDLLR